MDLVEVAPAYDQSEITALAAASIALEMLYIKLLKISYLYFTVSRSHRLVAFISTIYLCDY